MAETTVQTPGPAVDLIEHAAGIIVKTMDHSRSAPYHWAGALWEAGMLHAPGSEPAVHTCCYHASATNTVLADRERELLDLKGPCSTKGCRLHYAHSGPCHVQP
ncbi:hypothetical protein ACIODS_12295 [Micromonospora chalcea]|uniref:hypothetical protein n=1 Tax=Micromonospora chalcea TaxID=1874 RepID=UPI003825307D